MNEQVINTAIAEACGWTEIADCTCGLKKHGFEPIKGAHKKHLPSYTTDLNAIQAAVLTRPQDWQDRYTIQLTRLCGSHKLAVNAPADKRVHAFLLTEANQQPALDKSQPT